MEVGGWVMAELMVQDDMPDSPEPHQVTTYPATIKEMGWAQYLEALSARLNDHLPDVIGARAKKDVGNAARVLRAFSELDVVTGYLDALPDD